MTRTPTWDILICSIAHRTEMLVELLSELKRQLRPGVGVIVAWDNLEMGYGPKCQALQEASSADYICWLDDDDWVSREYVRKIRGALRLRPDYVGFEVLYTEDGVQQCPVYHSLEFGGWSNHAHALYRDIVHFNPIRRELALQARWVGGGGADIRWADQLRELGQVRTQVYLEGPPIHYYRKVGGGFTVPAPMIEPPPRPNIKWVRWL